MNLANLDEQLDKEQELAPEILELAEMLKTRVLKV